MSMTNREKAKHIDAFKYWCETNEENGVITLPKFLCEHIVEILDNNKEQPHSEWIPCSERLPETDKKVLVKLHNTYGKDVILMASHIGYHERTSEDYGWQEFEGDTEYDEENDCFWIPECWYESNYVEDNANWIIDECEGTITHWMPLPEPYKEEGEAE